MSLDLLELTKWFRDRPSWLQDAARRLLLNGRLDPGDLKELLILCKKEAGINIAGAESLAATPIPDDAFMTAESSFALRLESLAEIKGINALAPRKALEFGSEPLAVVYGLNGSGKSGYMRILKHACGARKLGTLHGDVFQGSSQGDKNKSCRIGYSLDGTKKELVWTPAGGVHSELASASLYDTDCAHVYVNEENEVAYEPNLLTLFRMLVDACEEVDETLQHEIDGQVSAKPVLPVEFHSTTGSKWFSKITRSTSEAEICATCLWDQKGEDELASLNQRLAETNPAEKAKTLLKIKGRLTEFIQELKIARDQLSDEVLTSLLAAKQDAITKRQVADIDAKKVFENAPLDGVGSESWKLLWEKARLYSEGLAYQETGFPNVTDEARCVLCQQTLTDEAKERLASFESFIKGSLELEAANAEAAVQSTLQSISEIPSGETLDARLDLIGVNDDAIRDMVRMSCDCLSKRRSGFFVAVDRSQVELLDGDALIGKLGELANNLESQAKIFQEDAKGDKKDELKERVKELECQKWLSQQRASIEGEVERLERVSLLSEARKLTHTKALSDKKSVLADALVTSAFVRRFEEELKSLGASHVQVELIKTKTTKGQVWHQIRLKDSEVPVRAAEVLSEGEFRVVSIAAFLANVEGKGSKAPFVFDDPISSLDQDFEEATASRLVALSKT